MRNSCFLRGADGRPLQTGTAFELSLSSDFQVSAVSAFLFLSSLAYWQRSLAQFQKGFGSA